MKAKVLINGEPLHVEDQNGTFKLTHHRLPTRMVKGEAELEKALTDKEGDIVFLAKDESETRIGKDTRHGQEGWRGSRYVQGHWDECYLFFKSLTDAIRCIPTGDLQEARNAF